MMKKMDIKHAHIVGVGGTLMGAFAAFLKRQGVRVTGSDLAIYPPMSDVLKNAGVEIFQGFSAANLAAKGKPDLVVIGNVIRADNPEAVAAREQKVNTTSLPEAMEKLFLKNTTNLVVAGTHGKTTTSSLLAYVLKKCGKDPSYFIGGVAQDLPHSFHVASTNGLFVLEGDEYDTAFWDKVPKFFHYLPDHAILTSIEFDHADIYADLAAVKRAFDGLVSRIRPNGHLIACWDYADVREVCKPLKPSQLLTYSSDEKNGARYSLGAIRLGGSFMEFEILEDAKCVDELKLQLPGRHNAMNALAVWIECRRLGLDPAQVREAVASFKGVKRRQEVRGEVRGVTVIDDFAHHPTAVKETLQALRGRYPGRRLIAVFEPRSATSRRKIFQKQYAEAFQDADQAWIALPYDQTKIPSDQQFSTEELIADLQKRLKAPSDAVIIQDVDQGVSALAASCKSGDVVAVLSNGGFGGFIAKLLQGLVSRSS